VSTLLLLSYPFDMSHSESERNENMDGQTLTLFTETYLKEDLLLLKELTVCFAIRTRLFGELQIAQRKYPASLVSHGTSLKLRKSHQVQEVQSELVEIGLVIDDLKSRRALLKCAYLETLNAGAKV
jgi:hypothetical protein